MLHLDPVSFRKGMLLVCRDGDPLFVFDENTASCSDLPEEDHEEYEELAEALDAGDGAEWAVEAGEVTPWVKELIVDQIGELMADYFSTTGPATRVDDVSGCSMYRGEFDYRPFADYIQFKEMADVALQIISTASVTSWIAEFGLGVGDSDMEAVFAAFREAWEGDGDPFSPPVVHFNETGLRDVLLELGCVEAKSQH